MFYTKMKRSKFIGLWLFSMLALSPFCLCAQEKPRVIVMTDAEVDDRSSMVHLLLCSNEVDIEGIIQAASFSHPMGHSNEPWLSDMIEHYAQVYPNLKLHADGYPSPEKLRSVCLIGDEDPTHIVVEGNGMNRFPGDKSRIDPTDWAETPGSKKIVETLLDADSRKVYLLAWGGGNTAAKAFQVLKDKYSPEEYQRAVRKAVMYNIWYQDGAGNYIETYHPGVTMLVSYGFLGTWAYGALRYSEDFVKYRFHKDNPLVADYPNEYINEGDSPSFFYVLGNGLRGYEDPTWGGWGGRFYKVEGLANVYRDVNKLSYQAWTEYILRDLEVRSSWCSTDQVDDANHYPTIELDKPLAFAVQSGETVEIHAKVTDADKPNPEAMWKRYGTLWQQQGMTKESFMSRSKDMRPLPCHTDWWQYKEAGTCTQWVTIRQVPQGISFVAPMVNKTETLHLIVEATDQGEPALTKFARVVVTINPPSPQQP